VEALQKCKRAHEEFPRRRWDHLHSVIGRSLRATGIDGLEAYALSYTSIKYNRKDACMWELLTRVAEAVEAGDQDQALGRLASAFIFLDQVAMGDGKSVLGWAMTFLDEPAGLKNPSSKPQKPKRQGRERFSRLVEDTTCAAVVGSLYDWQKLDENTAKSGADG
jgi:hypothetical protein